MDYCSSCRRHLNGALVCPGCGAYAPDIAPPVTVGRTGATLAMTGGAAATTAPQESTIAGTWHDRPLDYEAEPNADSGANPHTLAADVESPSPAQQGRAARRRQLARWKKNKRRASVASAFAIVGGGLTVAMMNEQSTERAQAATVPDQRSMGTAEERAPEPNPAASTPATTQRSHRSSETASQRQPQQPATNTPRQQSLEAPPHTAPTAARPAAAAVPPPAAPPTPQPQSIAPSADDTAERSDATTEQPPAPATADSMQPDAPRTDPALISASPTEVCVLMVCLG
ncbi:SCO2400 family protein [Streptomyces mutomycini]|uniref:Uncharacterized protein n=1 Tax=Streptomyces mutomycini TaxID=284036 RepID=A0ABW0BA36_9ACTN|nr:hypothetical protein [Streptomyces mutomycini]